jgi:hypothetical protein
MGARVKVRKTITKLSWIPVVVLVTMQPIGLGAQTVDKSGEWSVRVPRDAHSKIELRVWRHDRSDRWESSVQLDERTAAEILARLEAGDKEIRFTIEREAGTLRFEGSSTGSRGLGEFTFTEAAAFRSTMRALGFGRLDDDEVFSAALLDVGPRKAEEMAAIGFDRIDFDELVSASIFDVDADFVAEMERASFTDLDLDELVSLRVFDVDRAERPRLRAPRLRRHALRTDPWTRRRVRRRDPAHGPRDARLRPDPVHEDPRSHRRFRR